MEQIIRPLDLLNALRGRDVIVTLKDGKEIACKLIAFDIHINLVLDIKGNEEFIRGDHIIRIAGTSPNVKVNKKEVKK